MMLNRKLLAVLIFFVPTIAYNVSAQETFLVDKVVATIGGSSILYSDVVTTSIQLQQMYKENNYIPKKDILSDAFEKLIVQKILYNQAKVDSLTIDYSQVVTTVQSIMDAEISALGSMAAVEQRYGKPIYAIREDITHKYEESRYAMTMENKVKGDVKISSGDVERFFKSIPRDSLPIIPEKYSYSQIVMVPLSKAAAELRTRQRLLELKERILKGEKFESLAIIYSQDPGSATRGGEMDPRVKEGFLTPFADAMSRLRPGQISEVVQTDYGFHIIQLIDKQGNLYHCRHILLKPSYTTEERAAVIVKLDSLAGQIRSGNITFADAALKYSDDKYSRNNGGKATNLEYLTIRGQSDPKSAQTSFFKENLAPADYAQMRNMKPGDISNAFTSVDPDMGNEYGKIVRLDEVISAHDAELKKDYDIIESLALVDKQNKEFDSWLERTASTMYIHIDDKFKDSDFSYSFLKR